MASLLRDVVEIQSADCGIGCGYSGICIGDLKDFVLLQLYHIYLALKDKQCPLPPAHGNFAGTTSGPNGELLVVGVLFGDSEVDRLESYYRRKRAVLLGAHRNSACECLHVCETQ